MDIKETIRNVKQKYITETMDRFHSNKYKANKYLTNCEMHLAIWNVQKAKKICY